MLQQAGRSDILIAGGAVIDGTGAPRRRADVALQGDRIAAVGDLSGWAADLRLDASGLVVAPGFIDMHTHSDLALLINPRAESKLRQGVTTEVIGQCGFSPAPAPEGHRHEIRALFGAWGRQVTWGWGSFADYLDALRERRTSVNVVPVVGHTSCRAGVMGEESRGPTAAELSQMRSAVEAAMGDGAFGLSSGLVYAPGMFADTDELVALAEAVAPHDGVYFTHIRGEADTLLDAIAEAIEIGRRAGVTVQLSHLKAQGRQNWGKIEAVLAAVERAREDGIDVTYDVYPYTAWNTGLGQLLPSWAREGGAEAILARLSDPASRAQIRSEIAAAADADPGRWEQRLLASVDSQANRPLQGLTIAEIATRRDAAPEDVVISLLLEERCNASMVGFGMSEEDVRRALAHPLAMIGSDAAASAPYGILGKSHPHPRSYGAFPRVLGHYAREENLFPLEEAVAKMTSRPAARLGLTDRGRIAPGMAADLVVFDPDTITDRATYEQPHQYAAGVQFVIVNGTIELEGEEHRGRRAGRVLVRYE